MSPRSANALINPELLVWARKSLGLTLEQSAQGIGVDPDRLARWEAGDEKPTVVMLRKAASVYKRPFAVFYLPKPPADFDAMKDFRRVVDGSTPETSPGLRVQMRLARLRRDIAIDLAKDLGDEPRSLSLSATLDDSPHDLASKARALLGVSIDAQRAWRNKYKALNAWIAAVERQGVLVSQTIKVSTDEALGFSISEQPYPLIMLNGADWVRRRIFTLFHELAHILLRNGGLCDLNEYRRPRTPEQRAEAFSNRFSGALLVPTEALMEELSPQKRQGASDWSDEELIALSSVFQVSSLVVLTRLLELRLVSRAFYEAKWEQSKTIFEAEEGEGGGGGFLTVDRRSIKNNGRLFTNLVLSAYYQDSINLSDVSDYLRVNLKHLPSIEAEMWGSP